MPEHKKRTDTLSVLADKYNMSASDRITLFKLYLSAARPPEGYTWAPVEPDLSMLTAGLSGQGKVHSQGVWAFLKESLAAQYRKMIKVAPQPDIPILTHAKRKDDGPSNA